MHYQGTRVLPDLNADLGEQTGNDEEIMPYIGSCNIACGGHAGDSESIRLTVDIARSWQVKIGAHPGYPDRENFGRKHVTLSHDALVESLLWQIYQVQDYLKAVGEPLHHVKLHGALYNDAALDSHLATLVSDLLSKHFPTSLLYSPYGSKLANLAAAKGITVKNEVFADRRYQDDLALVPRSSLGACIDTWEEIQQQVLDMLLHQRVKTNTGNWRFIQAETICVHGDHPTAIQTAKRLHELLSDLGGVGR